MFTHPSSLACTALSSLLFLPLFSCAEKKPVVESQFPPGLSSPGNPEVREVRWTAYFKTETQPTAEGKGRKVIFTARDGKESILWVTPESFEAANLQSLAIFTDERGEEHYGFRMDVGKFTELPKGSMGMGNKSNPIVALVHVSANQKDIPYGSMIEIPESEAVDLIDGKRFEGFLWVGDTGSGVKGDHLDLFTGRERMFTRFVETVKKPVTTKIYKIPPLDQEHNPGLQSGLAKILRKAGYLESEEGVAEEDLKAALLQFQKDESHIPEAEYGNARAAVTLWFLTQAVVSYEGD
ncbi:MAG: 3D domain-containing protein [Verrucomicrobiota bacterium]